MPDAIRIDDLRIDRARLLHRLEALAQIGSIPGGGNARLALTDADKAGRDLVVTWMSDLGLDVRVDAIGNVFAYTPSTSSRPPVLCGSHIDTVRTGGRFDGNYGVLAGLEVIETLLERGLTTDHPLGVAFFTSEEGARFAPDMLGSLVHVGGLPVEVALDVVGTDGARLGDELERIGYAGVWPCPGVAPHAFVELHIEQGPVLDIEGITIGVVERVQGISWQEITVTGQSNHAGTTPMSLRHDAGYVAARIAVIVREIAERVGGDQVGTVGAITLHPNLINVVAASAVLTVDLRNTDDELLRAAEQQLVLALAQLSEHEGVTIDARWLARFEPVDFDPEVVALVERVATRSGLSTRRMPSGAGHDAQMLSRVCPTAMIFVPSIGGLSHNPGERTSAYDLECGANVLLHTLLELSTAEGAAPCPES
jgi:N-carbamoyl-L-amino-acid hydrolase